MQVFKAFFKIIRRKMVATIIYMVIFSGIAIALAMNGEEQETSFSQTSLVITVENLDEGELGSALTAYLSQNNEVVSMPETEDELLDAMFARTLDYVLYIPRNFTELFLKGEREGLLTDWKVPSSSLGLFADNQIESYLSAVGMYLEGGFELSESIAYANENLALTAEVRFLNKDGSQEKKPAAYYFQFFAYISICTIIMMAGPVLIAFRKEDLDARNKCSSMPFFVRNIQLISASVIIVLAEYAVMMALGFLIYPDYRNAVQGGLAMVNALLMVLFSLALTYLLVQLVRKEDALNAASNVFGLGLAFLGGVFVPLDVFPQGTLILSKFMPTYWYVTANDAISSINSMSEVTSVIPQAFIIEGIYVIALLAVGMTINRMKARA